MFCQIYLGFFEFYYYRMNGQDFKDYLVQKFILCLLCMKKSVELFSVNFYFIDEDSKIQRR